MGAITIKLSGPSGLSVIVDEEDYRTYDLGSYTWRAHIIGRQTYAVTDKNGKRIYLHRLIMGLEKGSDMVDHIDHNGLNNYRTNLRVTDNSGNQHNKRKSLSAKCTSTYKGVQFCSDKKTNPWKARISLSGKDKHLGYYRTETEAARSYNEAATKYYGTTAYLNELSD